MAKGRSMDDYWNYNLDHLAYYDVKAFIHKIHEIKANELKSILMADKKRQLSEVEIDKYIQSKLTITFVGHSLGGMVLPMYIINQKRKQEPHYVTHSVLLSPAGLLEHSPANVALSFGWFVKNFVSKITDHVAVPSIVIDAMQKLQNDISSSLPAARDLITHMTSSVLGGNTIGDSPVWKSAHLMKSSLMFGFSTNLCAHFYSIWKTGRFVAFDYGKKKNLEQYGQEKPLDYIQNYDLIDIPINFFISMNDILIRADDIIGHYNALKAHHPELAFVKIYEGFSHIDFTYGSHHSLTTDIINALLKFSTKDTHNFDKLKLQTINETEELIIDLSLSNIQLN